MAKYRVHVVRQGEHLLRLAFLMGFDAGAVWNDPKNQDLKALRGDGHILMPGDVLQIPEEEPPSLSFQAGTSNRYTAKVPEMETKLRLGDEKGAFAGERYVIEGLDARVEGTTDGDGLLSFRHPVTARVVTLLVPGKNRCMALFLGDMDPIEEISGVQKRLLLLGHYSGETDGELDDATQEAVAAFQASKGLPANGEIDGATRDALERAYGC